MEPSRTGAAHACRVVPRSLHHAAAAGVVQDGARLPLGEPARAHHQARPSGQRSVQAHVVRGTAELLEEDESDAERFLRVLDEPHDIVVLDVHVEAGRSAGYLLADVAEPHDPERLPRELVEARRREVAHPPLAGDDVVVLPDELLRDGQHERYRVLGDGDRVGAAVVADGDPRLPGGLEVHPVVAGADELDELHARCGTVEVRPEARAGKADEILGVLQGVQELGRPLLADVELIARRHDRAGDLDQRGGQLRRQNDLDCHGRSFEGRFQADMKILYTPVLIVPSLTPPDHARILEAAGPGVTLVEAKDPARQRAEIVDADVLFGRVTPDVLGQARRLSYYHSIGAGVDAILSPALVESDVVLASEKGEVGIHLAEHAFALLLGLTRGVHTALRTPDYSLREPIRGAQRDLYH